MWITLGVVASVMFGQAGPQPPAETSQFDFWLGSWNCVGQNRVSPDKDEWRQTRATNRIEKTMNGFVVQENFSMGDMQGMSVSTFNRATNKWQQTWVDNGGGYITLTGEFKDGKMTLQTPPPPQRPNGGSRMVFHTIKKDSFVWDWESTQDGGKTWKLMWRLNYTRAK